MKQQATMLSLISPDQRVPKGHPLRRRLGKAVRVGRANRAVKKGRVSTSHCLDG